MSSSQTAIVILGSLLALAASFGMTYSVYRYGSSTQMSETTQIIEQEGEHSGN